MKKSMILRVGGVIAAVLGFCVVFVGINVGAAGSYYYVRIDNSKVEENDSRGSVVNLKGSMDYIYTLPACNDKGNKKDISFSTSRMLREGAYLRLTVTPLRGVVEWKEVEYEELSADVRSMIGK